MPKVKVLKVVKVKPLTKKQLEALQAAQSQQPQPQPTQKPVTLNPWTHSTGQNPWRKRGPKYW